MLYRERFIKWLNSGLLNPSNFESLDDFTEYCNITSIVSFDFLDIELTKQICEQRWVNHFKNQKLLVSLQQNNEQ